MCQSARFVTLALLAPDVLHLETLRLQRCEFARNQIDGVIVGVVQDLNQKLVPRVIETRHGVNQASGDELFVIQRQLHGDTGELAQDWCLDRRVARPPIANQQYRLS